MIVFIIKISNCENFLRSKLDFISKKTGGLTLEDV